MILARCGASLHQRHVADQDAHAQPARESRHHCLADHRHHVRHARDGRAPVQSDQDAAPRRLRRTCARETCSRRCRRMASADRRRPLGERQCSVAMNMAARGESRRAERIGSPWPDCQRGMCLTAHDGRGFMNERVVLEGRDHEQREVNTARDVALKNGLTDMPAPHG